MATCVGTIDEIYRYPVKSLGGERLESCSIQPYGLEGDRAYAFFDETKEGWSRYVTARKIPELLSYQAKYNAQHEVQIKSPTGEIYNWDNKLLEEVQRLTKVKLSMLNYKDHPPIMPELMAVDAASILIITNQTISRLETLWGKSVDPRRFRSNIIVNLEDSEFDERMWIGARLRIGDAELQVDECCERCAMITIHPDTLDREVSLLRTVNEEMDLKFGVYASIVNAGHIRKDDRIYL